MADYHDAGGLILDGPFDPDAQATVTDYIDYTEYLPADLIRSLTLIRGLDERYLEATQGVHDLTKAYGQLPTLPSDVRPDARALRKDISEQLDRAINARESAYAEACRLYDVIDRHFNRLDSIKQKLEALPKPASREPTPPPAPPVTTTKRSRSTKKTEEASGPPTTTRITLRLDGHDTARATTVQKSRTRRSLISAEHLADLHPDSPIASTEHSDVEPDSKITPSESPPEPAAAPAKKEKGRRRSRTSGLVSTGAQGPSAPAISTSNALAMLKPPPDDAKPGSEDMPWLRLTEWEMTKLRKKMKKNAVWQPSEVMIHRELALRGRGWEAYRAAKAQAEATGAEFLDCDDIMNTYVPGKLTKRSEATGDTEGTFETKLSNPSVPEVSAVSKPTRAGKKRKLEEVTPPEVPPIPSAPVPSTSSAPSASAAPSTSDGPPTVEPSAPDGPSPSAPSVPTTATSAASPVPTAPAVSAAPTAPVEIETRPSLRSATKRRRTSKGSPTPVDPNIANPELSTKAAPAPTAVETSESQKPSLPSSPTGSKRAIAQPTISAVKAATPTPPVTRPPSRRSAALSLEPTTNASVVAPSTKRELRQKSATPARKTPVPETARAASVSAPNRRRKRPAPGPVSSGQDGGAAVSYGRRKAKPGKKRIGTREVGLKDGTLAREDIRIDEDGVLEEIDPNEPRYCLCGDVSFGTMICCENQECDREWFHLDCVGLSEVPSRTAKWYCPDCRVKFNKGADGIVKNNPRR
ncbi:CUE domain family protein [Aspergillus niger]|uniref:Chromatin modification-related protein n=1 Tax=Aspergillus niger TaxID=5061 RepID=A0A505I7E3_ASPNG|nr:CUE domain family protein [Aspergillus niger]